MGGPLPSAPSSEFRFFVVGRNMKRRERRGRVWRGSGEMRGGEERGGGGTEGVVEFSNNISVVIIICS